MATDENMNENKNENTINEPDAVSDEQAQEILSKFDKDSNTRHFDGVPRLIMRWMCVAFTIYMILINTVWLLPTQVHRASFVGLVVMFAFLLYPAKRTNNIKVNYIPWYDLILMLLGLGCFLYYVFNFENIVRQMATFTQIDFIVAVIGITILFIACKRVVGLPLMVVVALFLLYAYFGRYIPGIFGHGGVRVQRIFTYLFYTTEGVIGIPIGVASTFIFVFMLFGAGLEKTGIGQLFIDISNVIAGKATGGPAKVSVIVSALQGTVSGSSVANTVASGAFTIPMMKRMGFEKNFAGAVEAAASTGGQIVPPVLGAAAFLMAEITGIPFREIALAAVIPVVLYFGGVFAAVHFEAKKNNLSGMPEDEIPPVKQLLKRIHLVLGIAAIIFFLVHGFTPTRAALYAILVSLGVSMFTKETRLTPSKFVDILENGARNTVGVAVACAMAGMIVGVVTMTGLGMSFAHAMVTLAYAIDHEALRLLVALILCMFACLILGLGVPTTAKYVIMATIAAPVLVQLGIPILAAHMFVFYFATDADITPPVGLAAYAGAAISGGSPIKTCFIAARLAVAAYVVPFIFSFNPQMLFIDATLIDVIAITISGIIGVGGIAAGLSGYLLRPMKGVERLTIIMGGIALMYPGILGDMAGVAIIAAVVLWQIFLNKKEATAEAGA